MARNPTTRVAQNHTTRIAQYKYRKKKKTFNEETNKKNKHNKRNNQQQTKYNRHRRLDNDPVVKKSRSNWECPIGQKAWGQGPIRANKLLTRSRIELSMASDAMRFGFWSSPKR